MWVKHHIGRTGIKIKWVPVFVDCGGDGVITRNKDISFIC